MSVDKDTGDGVDEALRRAAEAEMRRKLPDADRPSKRAKRDDGYIEIGRFDYSAINELADGVACFLVSCTFRRERSATREVVALLAPHLPAVADKKEDNAAPSAAGPAFSNLKLSARGLVGVVLKLPGDKGVEEEGRAATAAALAAYDAVDSGAADTKAPHVQRIVPLASTCALEVDALRACAARVAAVAAPMLTAAERPTFGIAVASRGAGDAKHSGQEAAPPPERPEIIAAVAKGFTDALKERHSIEAAVDLKAPAVVVAVEVLPLAGRLFAGIAILPQRVCTLKPRLGMKPLKSNSDKSEKSKASKKKN